MSIKVHSYKDKPLCMRQESRKVHGASVPSMLHSLGRLSRLRSSHPPLSTAWVGGGESYTTAVLQCWWWWQLYNCCVVVFVVVVVIQLLCSSISGGGSYTTAVRAVVLVVVSEQRLVCYGIQLRIQYRYVSDLYVYIRYFSFPSLRKNCERKNLLLSRY